MESMDSLTCIELTWLLQNQIERQKQHYELIAHAVTVGYARTQTKKKIDLFPKSAAEKVKAISVEDKEAELDALNKAFK